MTLQNQDEKQNGMQNTANINVGAPVSDTHTSIYEPSAISPGASEAEKEHVHDQMTPIKMVPGAVLWRMYGNHFLCRGGWEV